MTAPSVILSEAEGSRGASLRRDFFPVPALAESRGKGMPREMFRLRST
jgi:hypothetical protein